MRAKILLGLRIVIAIILIQTLRYKFTGHPDSVYIFTQVGMEPYGRIAIGILELVAGILLLIPKTVWVGTLLTIGIIGGAIFLHITQLGISVNGDNGILFYTALITFILSCIVLFYNRKKIPILK
ncbi:DoxX-like protein [Lacinutrix venerupis]|uniref:DoxX family membrane protein n=1 Tax=Lacinutrix venerupis TaxID=1486034 RepID=UPI000EB54287|nr:DoxX family membrane protein [Lacinutrix venerupis]RLJ64293.1 DoxX-like protein [Lacinutrix venerupis]